MFFASLSLPLLPLTNRWSSSQAATATLGLTAEPAEIKKLMADFDNDNTGTINFNEFRTMMSSKLKVQSAGSDLGSLIALTWEELKTNQPRDDDFSLAARTHRLAVYSREPNWTLAEAVSAYRGEQKQK